VDGEERDRGCFMVEEVNGVSQRQRSSSAFEGSPKQHKILHNPPTPNAIPLIVTSTKIVARLGCSIMGKKVEGSRRLATVTCSYDQPFVRRGSGALHLPSLFGHSSSRDLYLPIPRLFRHNNTNFLRTHQHIYWPHWPIERASYLTSNDFRKRCGHSSQPQLLNRC
jgi:hypothetical protein